MLGPSALSPRNVVIAQLIGSRFADTSCALDVAGGKQDARKAVRIDYQVRSVHDTLDVLGACESSQILPCKEKSKQWIGGPP